MDFHVIIEVQVVDLNSIHFKTSSIVSILLHINNIVKTYNVLLINENTNIFLYSLK